MSRVASIPREAVEIQPRKMTRTRRLRLLEAADWQCSVNGCPKFRGWPLEIDHRIALALGGSDDDDNLVVLCRIHHAEKTKADMKAIAKAKRLIKKVSPDKPPSRLRSKPFSRELRKKMDGTVEKRR